MGVPNGFEPYPGEDPWKFWLLLLTLTQPAWRQRLPAPGQNFPNEAIYDLLRAGGSERVAQPIVSRTSLRQLGRVASVCSLFPTRPPSQTRTARGYSTQDSTVTGHRSTSTSTSTSTVQPSPSQILPISRRPRPEYKFHHLSIALGNRPLSTYRARPDAHDGRDL